MAGLAAMMPNEDIRDNFHQLIREVSGQHVKRVRSVLEVFFFFFFFLERCESWYGLFTQSDWLVILERARPGGSRVETTHSPAQKWALLLRLFC
jgi:hypothetical protein